MAGDAEDFHGDGTFGVIGPPAATARRQRTHRQSLKALRNASSCSSLSRTFVQAQGAASCTPQ
jgi:hypothetical protein